MEHLLGIFASLLRLLPGGSAARIRTLAKFMEKDYEKIDKLVKLRRDYSSRVSPVEAAIEKERKGFSKEEQEVMEVEWLSRRFDAGLFSVQVCLPSDCSLFDTDNYSWSTLFWHGSSLKTTARRRRLRHFWQTATRTFHSFGGHYKVRVTRHYLMTTYLIVYRANGGLSRRTRAEGR